MDGINMGNELFYGISTRNLIYLLEDYLDLDPNSLDYSFCFYYRKEILDELKRRLYDRPSM